MRIIHFSCVAPPEIGGIGRVASKEVSSLQALGHDAHLVSLTTHAGFRFGNAGSIHALKHFVDGADIVHLHYPFYGTMEELARLRRQGAIKKLVVTLHMDATATGIRGSIFRLHRALFQKKILDAADVLLASSRDYVEHSSFADVAARTIELPFGIDEEIFRPGEADHEKFGLKKDAPVVLFVGGMDTAHAFKGIPHLLNAMVSLSDTQLLLVGDGDQRKHFEKMAMTLGITDRCHFVGKLKDEDLVKAYRTADVFTLPSTSGAEAFGLVALEAQACGVPVVASNLPGVRTVVSSDGRRVPPGDENALAQALKEVTEGRGDMARAVRCRDFVLERFTWKKHMEGLIQAYENRSSHE